MTPIQAQHQFNGISGLQYEYTALLLLQRLGEIHFLDAGLNCRGAHLTDPQVISSLSQYVQQKSAGITIYLHGTPRQWGKTFTDCLLQADFANLLVATLHYHCHYGAAWFIRTR